MTLGQYIPGNSLIHKLDPRVKLLISFCIMIITFMLTRPETLLPYALFMAASIFVARLPFIKLLKSMKAILFLSIFTFIFNAFMGNGDVLLSFFGLSIYKDGLILAILMVLRLALLVIGTSVFLTYTTSVLVMATAFEDILKPLNKIGINSHEIAMMMSIALRFIPTISKEADKIIKAQSSRGANYDDGNFISKAKGMVSILVPLFVHSIKRAEELALAMESRCYDSDRERSRMKELKLTKVDIVAGIAIITFFILLLLLQFLL